MVNVAVLCEGETEYDFCKAVVAPWAQPHGIELFGTLVGRPGRKRGGIRPWLTYRNELLRLAKERPGRAVGVLVDYYAMPMNWPGRSEAADLPGEQRGEHVEKALVEDLETDVGNLFVPGVQMHEFESLLFVNPSESAAILTAQHGVASGTQPLEEQLQDIVQSCGTPDSINDTPTGAPSKRLERLVKGYDKRAWGVSVTQATGMERLRSGSSWLNRWLTGLEALPNF